MLKRLAVAIALMAVWAPDSITQTNQSMFVFRDNFWLNLHQFLRGEDYRRRTKLAPGIDPATLSEADRDAWSSAMDVYADIAKGDLVFDENARRIANTLAMTGDTARLPDGLLEGRTIHALNAAAPIYREKLWASRQRYNEAWNASAKDLVDRHQTVMKAALAKVYGITWPSEPYLVDAVGEIGPNSAVTHDGPAGFAAHIQPSTGSTRNTGDAPLELMFHEASHVPAVGGRITKMIEDECARQKLTVPPDQWHFMIMFTTGVITARELANTGSPGYASYGDRFNQIPPLVKSAFERDWLPHLDGKVSLERALHDLVRDAR
jgi:hypothetical protein